MESKLSNRQDLVGAADMRGHSFMVNEKFFFFLLNGVILV